MIRSSKKTRSRNNIIKQLDDLAREFCFARDGAKCQRCPSRKVQWCHIIGRRHKCVRWEPDNNLSLCAGCHMWWHEYPSLSGPWFAKNWPERHEHITKLFNAGGKVDLKALLETMSTPPAVEYYEPIKDLDLPF